MDRPAAGLEHDSCTDGDLLRRAYARVTPLCLDVKGQMNGFAALDIHPHRRYVVDIGGRRSSRCRLHINFALFLRSMDFTQNLGVTPKKILTNILAALYKPFGFSCLLSFFALFFYLYAYYPSEAGKGWKAAIHTWFTAFKVSSFFRKLFLLVFVTSMILFRTLLNRDLWMNPLSDVMGGWGIWETVNGERQLTTECIENVILMMPFTGMVMWTFDVEKGVVWKSTKLGLIFSVSIEMLQLLLRLGTFQVSDIVYNTLGGMLGGLCYIVGKKVHERLSK